MDDTDLVMVTQARKWCAAGDLDVLCEQHRVKGTWLAQAVAARSGLTVSPSTVSRWRRGQMLPDGQRAQALFKVVNTLVTAGGA